MAATACPLKPSTPQPRGSLRLASPPSRPVVPIGVSEGVDRSVGADAVFCVSLQVEGKGNGIKTVVVNMVDVAKALNRPPTCKNTPGTRSSLLV